MEYSNNLEKQMKLAGVKVKSKEEESNPLLLITDSGKIPDVGDVLEYDRVMNSDVLAMAVQLWHNKVVTWEQAMMIAVIGLTDANRHYKEQLSKMLETHIPLNIIIDERMPAGQVKFVNPNDFFRCGDCHDILPKGSKHTCPVTKRTIIL